MKKQSVRSFGIGIFLVGVLIYSMNTLNIPLPGIDTDASSKKEIEQLEKELAATKKELEEAKAAQTATTEDEASEDAIETTISIFRGNTAYDISRKLEDEGIIDNALQFELFLANGEYSRRIQIGEFTVSSDMTEEELATVLTTPIPIVDTEAETTPELKEDVQDEDGTNAEEEILLDEEQLLQP